MTGGMMQYTRADWSRFEAMCDDERAALRNYWLPFTARQYRQRARKLARYRRYMRRAYLAAIQ